MTDKTKGDDPKVVLSNAAELAPKVFPKRIGEFLAEKLSSVAQRDFDRNIDLLALSQWGPIAREVLTRAEQVRAATPKVTAEQVAQVAAYVYNVTEADFFGDLTDEARANWCQMLAKAFAHAGITVDGGEPRG